MNSFVCIALIAAIAVASVAANPTGTAAASINQEVESVVEAQQAQTAASAQAVADLTRLRKSASYGGSSYGASIPAPPCPKNYLFSCQPNLAPVPCSAPAPSYGSSGAYSAPVPTFVAPIRGNYGVPQTYNGAAYVPQGLGYNNYYQY